MTTRLGTRKERRLEDIRARNEIVVKVQVHGATIRSRVQQVESFPILEVAAEVIGIELRGVIHGILNISAVVGAFAV